MIYKGVRIVDISEEGNGIGRHEGKVIFVEGALPGEVVDVEVVRSKRKFDVGVVSSFMKKSEDRVEPRCKHFGICGGCSLQSVSYEKTLEFKRRWVESSFKKIGGLDVSVDEVFSSPLVYNYRNKVVFHGFISDGLFSLGFYRKGSRSFVSIEECFLIPSLFLDIKSSVEVLCREFKYFPSEVMFRVSDDGSVVVSFYGDGSVDSSDGFLGDISSHLITGDFNVSGVVFFDDNGSRVSSFGELNLLMEINEKGFLVSPESFFQVNSLGAGVLFSELKKRVGSFSRVFDLYCGVGSVGVCLGIGEIVGFEVVSSAVELARVNALSNGVGDVSYSVGRVGSFIGSMDFSNGDLVVVDPPRGGLEVGVVDLLCGSDILNVVYIGCGLGKMVRDVSGFVAGGFSLDSIFCVDLFPWTGHVETVVLMSRVDKYKKCVVR